MKLTPRQCDIMLAALEQSMSGSALRSACEASDVEVAELTQTIAAEFGLADGDVAKHLYQGTLDLGEMTVSVDEHMVARMRDSQEVAITHMRHVIDLRQELAREGLIKAGWTPPKHDRATY